MRDYEALSERCFVVRAGKKFDANDHYRIPSSVTLDDGCLYFGWTGNAKASSADARIIQSPKIEAAFPDGDENARRHAGFSAEEISILVVAYLLQVGSYRARNYCDGLSPARKPRMSMTMGVPMSIVAQCSLRDRFLRIARTAFYIWKAEEEQPTFADGVSIDRARELVATARREATQRPVDSIRNWIRSEAEAGLLWTVHSPRVKEGLYGCVDVGAGTTDVSFFRLRSRYEDGAWIKDALGFYSTRSSPPAVDALDKCLSGIDGGLVESTLLRGSEEMFIQQHGLGRVNTIATHQR